MNSRALIYQLLSFVSVLSMVLGLAPPAATAVVSQTVAPGSPETTPVAPSELAANWPMPQTAAYEPALPFLSPSNLVIEQVLAGVVNTQLPGRSGIWHVDPSPPKAFLPVNMPGLDADLPGNPDLALPEPSVPASLALVNSTTPFLSLPTMPGLLAEASPVLPQVRA